MPRLSKGGRAGKVELSTKFLIFEWAKAKVKKSFDSPAKTSSSLFVFLVVFFFVCYLSSPRSFFRQQIVKWHFSSCHFNRFEWMREKTFLSRNERQVSVAVVTTTTTTATSHDNCCNNIKWRDQAVWVLFNNRRVSCCIFWWTFCSIESLYFLLLLLLCCFFRESRKLIVTGKLLICKRVQTCRFYLLKL